MLPESAAEYHPIVRSGLSHDGRVLYALIRRGDAEGVHLDLRFYLHGGWRAPAGDLGLVAPTIGPDSDHFAALKPTPQGHRVVLGRLSALGRPPRMLDRGPHRPRVLKWSAEGRLMALGRDARGDVRVWVWDDPVLPPRALTPHGRPIADYAPHPHVDRLAWLERAVSPDPFTEPETALFVTDAGAGGPDDCAPRSLPTPGYVFGYLAWSPDGRWLALQARPVGAPLAPARLWVIDVDGEAPPRCLTEGLPGALGGFDWAPGGDRLAVALESGVEGEIWMIGVDGETERLDLGPGFCSAPRMDRESGNLIFLQQDADLPQRLCLRVASGTARTVGRFSARLEQRPLAGARVRAVQVGDLRIEGTLLTPAGAGPWPLILWAHGGPAHHISRTFSPYFQALVGAGYAVCAPNYRGSTGRGRAFCEAAVGGLTQVDVADLRAFLDDLIDDGVADPERVGVAGWSYGGALALALARDDPRVRAVAAGSPVADWIALFGAPTFPEMARAYFPDPPWVDRAPFDAASPATWIHRVRAPTLLLHGAEDVQVPPAQSVLLYRLLLARGVPCELAWYRGEGHTLRHPVAVVDMLRTLIGWFQTHLG
jgi:dipeptidyl aminopeptidase/acylaminoacyl peptidase